MHHAIGENLPLAIGIAISPIPIIASILMLLSPRARQTSRGFAIGWVVGVALTLVAFTLLANVIPEPEGEGGRPVMAALQLALGAALFVLAARSWRARPRPGEDPELPGWMAAVDEMRTLKAAELGFLLAAVNPKNLLLVMSAGVTFGRADLAVEETAVAIVIFVAVAVSTVVSAVIAFQLAPRRLGAVLEDVRTWLVASNATIMAVLLLVIGAQVIGKGIGNF